MSTYHKRPQFSLGKILRGSALQSLEQQCYDFPNLMFQNYGNGILTGCSLSTTLDTVTMGPGIISFEGEIYGIHEPISIEYSPTDTTCYLKLYIGNKEDAESCIMRRFSLRLTEQEVLGSGELELCRFRLQQGAYLRCDYVDFRDRDTIYDTMNTIHSTYAVPRGTGLSPEITRAYAKEVLSINVIPELDAMLCITWVDGKFAASGDTIKYYLQQSGCIENSLPGNQELFQGLLMRLRQLKEGKSSASSTQLPGRRKIMM